MRSPILPLLAIALTTGTAAAAFAYTAGWLSPDRLTPARIVDALSQRGGEPTGHRRNHAKGICVTGEFEANGAAARLTTAPMLAPGRYPVTGRFAIATGNPAAPDATGRVRSMALRITAPGGQEWRTGMNNSPVFVVADPQAFYELTLAARPDPATGRPDPAAMPRFVANHPEAAPFLQWARTAPWTASYAGLRYYALNAFRLVDAAGTRHPVRWSMEPVDPAATAPLAAPSDLAPDALAQDLTQRLAQAPLRWRLVITLAAPTDPTNDATKAWPEDRERIDAGTLTLRAAQDEATGPCRDINYDPLILPAGIEASDDPLLPARSAAYINSFDRRIAETARAERRP